METNTERRNMTTLAQQAVNSYDNMNYPRPDDGSPALMIDHLHDERPDLIAELADNEGLDDLSFTFTDGSVIDPFGVAC